MALPPQRPEDQAQDVARMVAQAMGEVPPGPPPGPPPAQDKDTQQDKAQTKGAPETEGERQKADPVLYEVDMGEGRKRAFTSEQLRGTLDRYSALNFRNAQLAPIHRLVEKYMADHPGLTPAQMADRMEEIYKAQEKNPTMGKTKPDDPPSPTEGGGNNQDISTQLRKWAEDNAVSLPPGYEQLVAGGQGQQLQAMQAQIAQMGQMLQRVLGQAGGTAAAARDSMNQAATQRSQAIQQTIASNIDRVQQALKLPDDKAQDFMIFAAERGYTLEDFVDPQLTIRVMQDFRNQMDSPEMERMRSMSQRRQAYTGSMGAGPGTGGTPAGASEMGSTFDQFAARAMASKGLGQAG